MALLLRTFTHLNRTSNLKICRNLTPLIFNRQYASQKEKVDSSLETSTRAEGSSSVSTNVRPIGEKIKETAKTTSYLGVILIGVGVTGIMFYAIFSELFSSNSPNAVYTAALEKCIEDPRVQDSLGQPIKGYGEETRRRRRTHVAHQVYLKDGIQHMRLQFHIQGIRNKATVHADMRMNSSGKYEYRYLFVQLDSYPHTTIILEDNRINDPFPQQPEVPQDSSKAPLKGIFS